MVTVPAAAGQVKTGVALAALSNVPAVAVHPKVGVTEPADAVAAREIGLFTVVSRGETLIESMFAQIWVVPVTTTVPASAPAPEHARFTPTLVVIPELT